MDKTNEEYVLNKLLKWGEDNENLVAMVLTSSRVNPGSTVDKFSDFDIELYVKDKSLFLDDDWLNYFGKTLVKWPLSPNTELDKNQITRLVLFESGLRIDFQVIDSKDIDINRYDSGYKILIDKDNILKSLIKPSYQEFLIKKPNIETLETLINDFYWDIPYVAKNLWRDELFYAKYMLDSVIRFEYFLKMIEWYIASQNDWAVSTNKYGRDFKKFLSSDLWKELESTFAGSSIDDNWTALFNTIDLFYKLGLEVSKDLNFQYPENLHNDIRNYCISIKETSH